MDLVPDLDLGEEEEVVVVKELVVLGLLWVWACLAEAWAEAWVEALGPKRCR